MARSRSGRAWAAPTKRPTSPAPRLEGRACRAVSQLTVMKLAEKMSRLGTESAFDVLVRARALEQQGRRVIHLEIGEPDFPTPAHVVAEGQRALADGWTKYGPPPGLPELRDSIAAYVSRTRGIS